jgi:hypothetical protein
MPAGTRRGGIPGRRCKKTAHRPLPASGGNAIASIARERRSREVHDDLHNAGADEDGERGKTEHEVELLDTGTISQARLQRSAPFCVDARVAGKRSTLDDFLRCGLRDRDARLRDVDHLGRRELMPLYKGCSNLPDLEVVRFVETGSLAWREPARRAPDNCAPIRHRPNSGTAGWRDPRRP